MESFALWLLGLGAALLLVGQLAGSPPPRLHLMLEGQGDKLRDRIAIAVNVAGLGCGAIGSTALMVTAVPGLVVVLASLAGVALVVYGVLLARLRQLWSARLDEAEAALLTEQLSRVVDEVA